MVDENALSSRRRSSNVRIRRGPNGVHLFSRTTGLNVLLDELDVPRARWDRAPRQVSVALTNACDLECSYCYAPKTPATQDFGRLLGWLDELDANGCLGVGFGGGEPALYKRLPELCRYAAEKTGLAVTLTTHGHLFDAALARALTGNVHFIRVSMDGVGSTYESLRRRSFASLLVQLEVIRHVAPFGINFVVNSRTIPDLDAAARLAASIRAADILLLPEVRTRTATGIDEHTSIALLRWATRYRGPVPLNVSETGADGLPVCDPLAAETGLRAYAHIDASGVLKRCSYDSNGVSIGLAGFLRSLDALIAA
jgi:MoaA/NifB/PqqE/SkfB family radical SAM enzyme